MAMEIKSPPVLRGKATDIFSGLILRNVTIIFFSLIFFSSCNDEEIAPSILPPSPVASFDYSDHIDFFSVYSTSTGEISEYLWQVTGDHQVILKQQGKNYADFDLPSVETSITFTLTVKNSGGSSTCTKTIDLPALTYCRKYGLGKNSKSEHSNNVDYEWYIDQTVTGDMSQANCGPSCATMAMKWSDQSFNKTTEDARKAYSFIISGLTGWFQNTMLFYLRDNYAEHKKVYFWDSNNLKSKIDDGNIAILALNMKFIRSGNLNNPEWRIDGINTGNWNSGHFIIVKGYKIVDETLWLEVYDPYSNGLRYNDGTLKGRDRYYRGEDIMQAMYNCKDISQAIDIGNPYPEMIILYRKEDLN